MDISLAERVEAFATSKYAFENLLVHAVDVKGNILHITSMRDFVRARERNQTVRVLRMENFNLKIRQICEHLRGVYDHYGPISCSAVIAQRGAPAVGWTVAETGIWIKVIRGKKTVQYENGVDTTTFEMGFDQSLYLAPGTRYRSLNNDSSITLVVRLEKFTEDLAL